MFFVRIILLGMGFLGAYLGTLSFQEGSGVDIAVGIAGFAVALLCFFFLAQALWKILGCMTTFIIVSVIVGGLVYFIYSSGLLNKFQKTPSATQQTQTQSENGKQDAIQNWLNQLPNMIDKEQNQPATQPAEPEGPKKVPVVGGSVSEVASGDLFKINNVWVRLFGLASPLPQQTCVNKNGRTFACGKMVINKFKEIVAQEELFCTVLGVDVQGAALSTCTIAKDYDLGVVLIENGYAVALRNVTPVYTPYEDEARLKKIGLWAGQFQMPWDWIAQQQQIKTENVTIPKMKKPAKKSKKSIFDFY